MIQGRLSAHLIQSRSIEDGIFVTLIQGDPENIAFHLHYVFVTSYITHISAIPPRWPKSWFPGLVSSMGNASVSVIASNTMDFRSYVSLLERHYPSLGSEHHILREGVTVSSLIHSENSVISPPSTIENDVQLSLRRKHDLMKLDEIFIKIQKQPESERLLLSPTEAEFYDIARHGSIICFNVTDIGSQAFPS